MDKDRGLNPRYADRPTTTVIGLLSEHKESLEHLCLLRNMGYQEFLQNYIFTGRTGAILTPFKSLKSLRIDLNTLAGTFKDRGQLQLLAETSLWPGISYHLPASLQKLTLRYCLDVDGGNRYTYGLLRKIADDLRSTQDLPLLRNLELMELHTETHDEYEELEEANREREDDDDEEENDENDEKKDEEQDEEQAPGGDSESTESSSRLQNVLEGNPDFKQIFEQARKDLTVELSVQKERYIRAWNEREPFGL